METIIIHPNSKQQASLFEQLAKALNVPFEKTKIPRDEDRSLAVKNYGREFVEKIEQAEQNHKKGKTVSIKVEDLWK